MTADGIKELINNFETELKELRNDDSAPPAEWEPPSLERIKRKMNQ